MRKIFPIIVCVIVALFAALAMATAIPAPPASEQQIGPPANSYFSEQTNSAGNLGTGIAHFVNATDPLSSSITVSNRFDEYTGAVTMALSDLTINPAVQEVPYFASSSEFIGSSSTNLIVANLNTIISHTTAGVTG